jgi:acyl-CoA reductase-like NAD-dependent aldehyde dehydrogenase
LFLLLFYCIKVYYYECNVVARLVASSRALIFSFCSWRLKRSRIVHKFADLVEQHTGEQAALDDGKLLLLGKIIVVPSAVQMLRYCTTTAGIVTRSFDIATPGHGVGENCYFAFDPDSPFDGYKMSGFGRDQGMAAMD